MFARKLKDDEDLLVYKKTATVEFRGLEFVYLRPKLMNKYSFF